MREREEIVGLTLVRYRPAPLVQDRVALGPDEMGLFREAMTRRSEQHLPFWDGVMQEAAQSGSAPGVLFDAALYHQSQRGSEILMRRSQVLTGELGTLAGACGDECLAVTSEIQIADGSLLHLPLMDFHCPIDEPHRGLALAVAQRVLPSGFALLEGHRSFHLWGLTPITREEWMDFLGRALLFAPIVDRAYLAHQLLERRCALRISVAGDEKAVPRVVHVEAPAR